MASAVFDAAHEAIVVLDAQRDIIAVNPAFTTLSGYTEDESLGKKPFFFEGGRSEADYHAIWNIVAQEGVWQGKFWGRRKDGGLCAMLCSFTVPAEPRSLRRA